MIIDTSNLGLREYKMLNGVLLAYGVRYHIDCNTIIVEELTPELENNELFKSLLRGTQ